MSARSSLSPVSPTNAAGRRHQRRYQLRGDPAPAQEVNAPMQGQHNRIVCDGCGNTPVVKQLERDEPCAECWTKRSNWDEGARFNALRMIGFAVDAAKNYGAERWAIYSAVELALTGPTDPHDEYEGVHSDDAHQLAAHEQA
jgi:hypothetical protein